VIPVVRDDIVVAAVVAERRSPRAFDQADLDEAAAAVEQMSAHLGAVPVVEAQPTPARTAQA
jgi:hypothetical protein